MGTASSLRTIYTGAARPQISLAHRNDVVAVRMSFAGTARFSSGSRFLKNAAMGPCVSLFLYDITERVGGCVHAVPGDNPLRGGKALWSCMAEAGSSLRPDNLLRYLTGGADGFDHSFNLAEGLAAFCDGKNIPVSYRDLYGENIRTTALDLESGELCDYIHDMPTYKTPCPPAPYGRYIANF